MRRRQSLQNNSIIDRVSAGNKGPVLWVLIKDPRRRRKMEKDKKRRGSKAAESRRSLWEIKGSPSFSHTQKKKKALGSLTGRHASLMCIYLDVVSPHRRSSVFWLQSVGEILGITLKNVRGKDKMFPGNKTHFRDFRRHLVSVLHCFALKARCARFSAI